MQPQAITTPPISSTAGTNNNIQDGCLHKNRRPSLVQMARKGDRTIYLQCTYAMTEEATIRREYAPLEAIQDNFEKIVVSSLDDVAFPSNNEIRHLQAWHLEELF